jgi:hypothetical protein
VQHSPFISTTEAPMRTLSLMMTIMAMVACTNSHVVRSDLTGCGDFEASSSGPHLAGATAGTEYTKYADGCVGIITADSQREFVRTIAAQDRAVLDAGYAATSIEIDDASKKCVTNAKKIMRENRMTAEELLDEVRAANSPCYNALVAAHHQGGLE